MTRMQKEMQERISREQLDQAFGARFPEEMRTKLRNARVAVAGLGGLGSNIAVMLARSGIGELLLVDFDTVDVTNLNRQMYLIPQLGKPKAEALPEILYQINPYLTYRSVCIKVTPDNVKKLFSEYSVVCEAFDKPDQKAMLVRELLMQCPKTIVVSGNGMAGYADANEIRTCQVMKRLYVCGDQSTDVGNGIGLIAPRVAVCAAHEANKVLQLIMQTES